jgi:hypothetical protein
MSRTPLNAPEARTWTETVPAHPVAKLSSPTAHRRTMLFCAALGVVSFDLLAYVWGRMFFTDTWLALTGGRFIVEHGLPHTDTLTVAAHGRPWIDQQWLAHLIYYGTWVVGGYPLVGVLSAASIATAVSMLAWMLAKRGAAPITVLGVLGFPLCILLFSAEPRAQTLTYPLYVAVLWLILDDANRRAWTRGLVWIVPILVLWANLHGSVLLAAGVCVAYFGVRALTAARAHAAGAGAYAAIAAASAASVVATPYGTGILSYYVRILNDPALHTIAEWRHSTPAPVNVPFFLAFAVTAMLAILAHRHGRAHGPLVLWVLVAVLGGMAFYAVRNQIWFGFAAALLAAQLVTATWPTFGRSAEAADGRLITGALALIPIATLAVIAGMFATPTTRFDSAVSMPAVRATDGYLVAHPATTVLADDITGTELLWLYPGLAGRVGYDARTEIYKPASIHTLARFLSGRNAGWEDAIAGYDVISLSCKQHAAVCRSVVRLRGWRRLPHTPGGVVMVRTGTPVA